MSVYAALTMMGWGWDLLASLITYVDGTMSFVSYSTDKCMYRLRNKGDHTEAQVIHMVMHGDCFEFWVL